MRFLRAALAGLFVVMVGIFTAAVIAVSAVVIFIGRRLKGNAAVGRSRAGEGAAPTRAASMHDGDVIDVTATEVRGSSSGS